LPEAVIGVVWHKPEISAHFWQEILGDARSASSPAEFNEDVFVVLWSEAEGVWKWRKISRERSRARALADDSGSEYRDACIELHTHPPGAIHFSSADDEDESGKFRIFGILSDVHDQKPKIRFRCGVYDYFVQIHSAYILEVAHICESFDYEEHLKKDGSDYRQIRILIGCVDNPRARREIHRKSEKYNADAPAAWWIDGGNGKSSGQVLIGSATKKIAPEKYFPAPGIARALPAPSLVHPELLENQKLPAKRRETERVSFPEMIRLGEQSLNINSRVAIEISEMLTGLLLTGSLRRFATYFELESGTSRSRLLYARNNR
jgi:hypothetical protein